MNRHGVRTSMWSSRRAVLALLASGVGGCLDRSDGGDGTQTGGPPTTTERSGDGGDDAYALVRRSVGESVSAPGGDVTVENPRVRKAVVVDQHTSPVAMHRGTQFVVVDVPHTLPDATLGPQFRAFLDGRPAAGRSTAARASDRGELTVAAPAPAQTVDEVGVAWVRGLPDSVLWSLPSAIGDRLGREPVFTVHGVTRRTGDDVVVVQFDVENTGDRDGTLHAVVRNTAAHDAYDVVSFVVPVGQRVTETAEPSVETDPSRTEPLLVEWGTGSRRLETGSS
jgi:hypothetical protein